MADDVDPVQNVTGLSDEQCKELHQMFTRGTTMWIAVAAVAHALVWSWQPWFPAAG
ncbi:MAG: light-harvesting antenna LH1, beta subunit [Pseudomonadota bacterium]